MGSVRRHTLIYGLGVILSRAISFIMLPVYTRFLTPADYGVMELIGMTLDFIAIIAGAQMAVGIFRYYHKADTDSERRAVVSTALLGMGLSYATVGAVTWLFANPLSTLVFGSAIHGDLIRIASVTLAFQSLMTVPLAYARVRDRSMLFVLANFARLVIGLGFNILFLVFLGMGVKGVLLSSLIASTVVGLWLAVGVLRDVGFHFSRAATRDLLRYGIPMIATSIATFITTFGDRYFLQAAGDTAAVGLYSLAYTFGFMLAVIGYVPFMQVWEAKRFEVAKRPDRDAVLAQGFLYLNVLMLTVAVGIALFVNDLLHVMTSPAFYAAGALVPVILVAYVLQGWTSLQDIGILVRERTEFVTLANWIAAAVAVAGYALLVPRWLGWGAAIATVAAFLVRHVLIYALSQRLWPVRYRWAPVIRLSTLAVVTALAGLLVPQDNLLRSIALHAALFLAYLVALWHVGILSGEDKRIVRTRAHAVVAHVSARLHGRLPQGA